MPDKLREYLEWQCAVSLAGLNVRRPGLATAASLARLIQDWAQPTSVLRLPLPADFPEGYDLAELCWQCQRHTAALQHLGKTIAVFSDRLADVIPLRGIRGGEREIPLLVEVLMSETQVVLLALFEEACPPRPTQNYLVAVLLALAFLRQEDGNAASPSKIFAAPGPGPGAEESQPQDWIIWQDLEASLSLLYSQLLLQLMLVSRKHRELPQGASWRRHLYRVILSNTPILDALLDVEFPERAARKENEAELEALWKEASAGLGPSLEEWLQDDLWADESGASATSAPLPSKYYMADGVTASISVHVRTVRVKGKPQTLKFCALGPHPVWGFVVARLDWHLAPGHAQELGAGQRAYCVYAHFTSITPLCKPNKASGSCFRISTEHSFVKEQLGYASYLDVEYIDLCLPVFGAHLLGKEYSGPGDLLNLSEFGKALRALSKAHTWLRAVDRRWRRAAHALGQLGKEADARLRVKAELALQEARQARGAAQAQVARESARYNQVQELTLFIAAYSLLKEYPAPIFMAGIFDFRGRYYPQGLLSPLRGGFYRHCLMLKPRAALDIAKLNQRLESARAAQPKLAPVEASLAYAERVYAVAGYSGAQQPDLYRWGVLWALVALGDQVRGSARVVPLTVFLEKGVGLFEKLYPLSSAERRVFLQKDFDIKDVLDILHVMLILEAECRRVLGGSRPPARRLQKDCTASVYQQLFKILGGRPEAQAYCNLDAPDLAWRDTYAFIIDTFLAQTAASSEAQRFLTRKTVKQVIMTQCYAATPWRSRQDFRTAVEAPFRKHFKVGYSEALWRPLGEGVVDERAAQARVVAKEVSLLFEKFLIFLSKGAEGLLFEVPSTAILDWCSLIFERALTKDHLHIRLTDGTAVDLMYFTPSRQRLKVSIPKTKQRGSFTHCEYGGSPDPKRLSAATRANVVHALDAHFSRELHARHGLPLVAIHDCWLVDCLDVTFFIVAANQAFGVRGVQAAYKWPHTPPRDAFSIFIAK